MQDVMAKARKWTRGLIKTCVRLEGSQVSHNRADPNLQCLHSMFPQAEEKPKLWQDELADAESWTSDPAGREALQGFERLMRHVALWEMACKGEVM